jgi:cysteine peptidase C11 family protein
MAKKATARKTVQDTKAGTQPEWAVYIYMKPDAALEEFAERDLQEMAAGVTGSAFPVVVQVEQERDVRRLSIANSTAVEIPADEWRTAPGQRRPVDPEAGLTEFVTWAQAKYPSRQRFIVLWGHSRGVGIDFIGPSAEAIDVPDAGLPSLVGGSAAPAPDGLRLEELLQFAAASVKRVQQSQTPVVSSSIDLLGFDSCYMSNAEFAHELSGRVNLLIAADGAVKRTGWNYRIVLGALTARPDLDPAALAAVVVEHVSGLDGDVSLARLDLRKSDALREAFAGLVGALRQVVVDPDEAHALFIMLKRTAYFQVRQFLDLRDLCHQLRTGFDGDVRVAAERTLQAYENMVFSRATGLALGRLNGISIYCPLFRAQAPFGDDTPDVDAVVESATYQRLKFVSTTGWLDLCRQLQPRLAGSRL